MTVNASIRGYLRITRDELQIIGDAGEVLFGMPLPTIGAGESSNFRGWKVKIEFKINDDERASCEIQEH